MHRSVFEDDKFPQLDNVNKRKNKTKAQKQGELYLFLRGLQLHVLKVQQKIIRIQENLVG